MRWGRGGDRPLDDLSYFVGSRRRWRNVAAVPWRYRYELLVTAALLGGCWAVAHSAHPGWLLLVLALAAGVSLVLPVVRRALVRRFWCVLLPHRMRVGMIECGLLSWSGVLPGVLWSAARPRGVQITVWCPAGVYLPAFEATRAQLAAACWAADVEPRLWRPRWSHIVCLLVIMRPEYTSGSELVRSATQPDDPGPDQARRRGSRAAVAHAEDPLGRRRRRQRRGRRWPSDLPDSPWS